MYLGSSEKNYADCADEVKLGTAMGMTVTAKLTKMWNLSQTQHNHYTAIAEILGLLPVMTYG